MPLVLGREHDWKVREHDWKVRVTGRKACKTGRKVRVTGRKACEPSQKGHPSDALAHVPVWNVHERAEKMRLSQRLAPASTWKMSP